MPVHSVGITGAAGMLGGALIDVLHARHEVFATGRQTGYAPPGVTWDLFDLLDERSLSRGWFEPDAVRRTINEHIEGRINHRLLLWSLLSFEWWNRLFLDEPAGDALARPAVRGASTA